MSWTHPAYDAVIRLLGERTGLSFPPQRHESAEHGVRRAMARAGATDPEEFLGLAARDARVLDDLVVELTVGETYFFRNEPQFQALEQHILPELIARRRPSRQLRLWSAGCASGEEPYSLAILLERLLPDLADWHILILATDINPQVLARAKRGCYGEWSFRQTPAEIRDGRAR